MLYEIERVLASQSYERWISQEVFSPGWLIMVGVLVAVYSIWFKIVDKRKLTSLLLLGSLSAVGFGVSDLILEGLLGVWEYQIRLIPIVPPLFVTSYTIGPILFMTVAQNTTSWKSYLIWSGIGTAVIIFVLLPFYATLGIIKVYNFNSFYSFILYMIDAIIARAIVLGLQSVEQSQPIQKYPTSANWYLQPAVAKPLQKSLDENPDNE